MKKVAAGGFAALLLGSALATAPLSAAKAADPNPVAAIERVWLHGNGEGSEFGDTVASIVPTKIPVNADSIALDSSLLASTDLASLSGKHYVYYRDWNTPGNDAAGWAAAKAKDPALAGIMTGKVNDYDAWRKANSGPQLVAVGLGGQRVTAKPVCKFPDGWDAPGEAKKPTHKYCEAVNVKDTPLVENSAASLRAWMKPYYEAVKTALPVLEAFDAVEQQDYSNWITNGIPAKIEDAIAATYTAENVNVHMDVQFDAFGNSVFFRDKAVADSPSMTCSARARWGASTGKDYKWEQTPAQACADPVDSGWRSNPIYESRESFNSTNAITYANFEHGEFGGFYAPAQYADWMAPTGLAVDAILGPQGSYGSSILGSEGFLFGHFLKPDTTLDSIIGMVTQEDYKPTTAAGVTLEIRIFDQVATSTNLENGVTTLLNELLRSKYDLSSVKIMSADPQILDFVAQAAGEYTAATPPDAPSKPTVVAGDGQATVSIEAVAGAVAYTVTSTPGDKTCTIKAPATSCVVTGLKNGTKYTFTAVAKGLEGESEPSPASAQAIPDAAPAKPAAPTVKAGDASIVVTRGTPAVGGTPKTYVATATPGGAKCDFAGQDDSCTITGLTNGTAYTVSLVASNDVGSSDASDPSASVTPSAPAPPPMDDKAQTTSCNFPKAIKKGKTTVVVKSTCKTNADETVAVKVTAKPKSAVQVIKGAGGKVSVKGKKKGKTVKITFSAPAVTGYEAMSLTKTYKIK